VAFAVVSVFAFYMVRKFARWQRFVREFSLARIKPEQLRAKLSVGEDILLLDLQGPSRFRHQTDGNSRYSSNKPRRREQYREVEIPRSQQVVLYCACPGEFTNARVTLALRQKGIEDVRPLAGGLQGWRDRGFPATTEVQIPVTRSLRVEFGCPKLFRTARCSASIRAEHRTGCIRNRSRGERTRGEAQRGRQSPPASLAELRRPRWPY
jgi:rhodanese-related sulfurtransferase